MRGSPKCQPGCGSPRSPAIGVVGGAIPKLVGYAQYLFATVGFTPQERLGYHFVVWRKTRRSSQIPKHRLGVADLRVSESAEVDTLGIGFIPELLDELEGCC